MSELERFPWSELGIAPTRDREAIRAAYAARLKRLDPRADTAAFQALRRAYEHALRSGAPAPPPMPMPGRAARVEPSALGIEIGALIAAGDAPAAAARLAGAGADALSFDELSAIERGLLALAPELPRATLRELVRRFDWDRATHPLRPHRPEAFRQIDQRMMLEAWHADLTALRDKSTAARLLLRGKPEWHDFAALPIMTEAERRKMLRWLNQLEQAPHVDTVFDPERLRWCRRWTRRWRVYLVVALAVVAIAPVFGVAHSPFQAAVFAWVSLVYLFVVWRVTVLAIRGVRWLRAGWRRAC